MDSVFEKMKAEQERMNAEKQNSNPNAGGGDTPPAAPSLEEGKPTNGQEGPNNQKTPAAKTFNPHDIFGDDYKDKDWESVAPTLKDKLSKAEQLERDYEALKKTPPSYANENSAAYDAWLRNGGSEDLKVFGIVRGFKEDMNDIDAIVAKRVMDNPHFLGLEEEIKNDILKEYKIESTEDEPLTEVQVKYNKARLASEAEKAKVFLKGEQEKMRVQQVPAVNQEEVIGKRKEGWSVAADSVLSKLNKITIPIVTKDGDKDKYTPFMDYQIPESILKEYKEELVDVFSRVSDVSEETKKQLEGEAITRVVMRNLPHIMTAALDKKEAELTEMFEKKYAGNVLQSSGSGNAANNQSNRNEQNMRKVIG